MISERTGIASEEQSDRMEGSEESPRQPEWAAGRCHRCGGLTVVEELFEEDGILALSEPLASRCVNCGDMVDPIILLNRAKVPLPREERP